VTDSLQREGAALWPKTYGDGMDDARSYDVIASRIAGDDAMFSLWATKWVDGGCRIIDTSEDYFSAMAQTKISVDALPEIRIPWPAFLVRIPSGILVDDAGTNYTQYIVGQFDGMRRPEFEESRVVSFSALGDGNDSARLASLNPHGLADSLFHECKDELECPAWDPAWSVSERRVLHLAHRAVAGLLFTMQHTNNWKRGGIFSKAGTGRPDDDEPPPHRSIIIGRPLSIDVTEAVRADARSGAHTAPSVQTLVRGHIKRQVVGVGRTGRKVVWIEPYWRGPEDAPILARPHLVGA